MPRPAYGDSVTPGLYDDVHAALFAAGVRYVVVGGTAVVLQGHARMTIDLDLVVDLAADQALAAVQALQSLGLRPRLPVAAEQFADAGIRREWVEHRNLRVFSFYDPNSALRDVDLFAEEPLPFEELYGDSVVMQLAGAPVRVASRPHLITMKIAAGRPVDLQDVEALRAGGADTA